MKCVCMKITMKMKKEKKMNNRKIAMLYSKINGIEKIRICSKDGKVSTIEGKSISEFMKEYGKISLDDID